MLKLKLKNKYILSFLALFLLLMSMGIKPLTVEIFGESILIKTKAYDPRDVFRGDYVKLNYEINEITFDKLDQEMTNKFIEGDYFIKPELAEEKLYVSLTKNGSFYEVEKVSLNRPSEGIYIIGEYSYTVGMMGTDEVGLRVEYTLDKFFVPENTGKDLENKVINGEAFALIKVFRGDSILKDVVAE